MIVLQTTPLGEGCASLAGRRLPRKRSASELSGGGERRPPSLALPALARAPSAALGRAATVTGCPQAASLAPHQPGAFGATCRASRRGIGTSFVLARRAGRSAPSSGAMCPSGFDLGCERDDQIGDLFVAFGERRLVAPIHLFEAGTVDVRRDTCRGRSARRDRRRCSTSVGTATSGRRTAHRPRKRAPARARRLRGPGSHPGRPRSHHRRNSASPATLGAWLRRTWLVSRSLSASTDIVRLASNSSRHAGWVAVALDEPSEGVDENESGQRGAVTRRACVMAVGPPSPTPITTGSVACAASRQLADRRSAAAAMAVIDVDRIGETDAPGVVEDHPRHDAARRRTQLVKGSLSQIESIETLP